MEPALLALSRSWLISRSTWTGTDTHYCFKELPEDQNPQLALKLAEIIEERPCLAIFPNLTTMSEVERASLCCSNQDCQDNAGCFLDEVGGGSL